MWTISFPKGAKYIRDLTNAHGFLIYILQLKSPVNPWIMIPYIFHVYLIGMRSTGLMLCRNLLIEKKCLYIYDQATLY